MNDSQIPISLVAHHAFCPRRAWLEAVGERTDTEQVAIGLREHRAVDRSTGTCGSTRIRAIEVTHPDLGLTGRVDELVQVANGWRVREHKATPLRRLPTVTAPMRIQIALQVACLVEMGWQIAGGETYFRTHNLTVDVPLGAEEFDEAMRELEATRTTVERSTAPQALEDDPRCRNCSHVEVCLPDERRLKVVRRRVKVADPDAQVVYLSTPGSLATVRRGRLRVSKSGESLGDVPIERVQGVQVVGNVDLSSGLIRELLWRDLPIVWTTSAGRVVGWAASARSPNGGPRAQSRGVPTEMAMLIARQMIHGKIANQATQMRRLLRGDAIVGLRQVQQRVLTAVHKGHLFGIEGEAAAFYFQLWNEILPSAWEWPGRRTRGATDRINAALNFLYALLCGDAIRALALAGLDPHAGLLHSSSRNKPALALDLIEEFRAPIADSVLLDSVSRQKIALGDFRWMRHSVRLSDDCRKALIRAYETRMTTAIRHPVFGYQVTWRRALEVQARQILGVIDGSQPHYQAIKVR